MKRKKEGVSIMLGFEMYRPALLDRQPPDSVTLELSREVRFSSSVERETFKNSLRFPSCPNFTHLGCETRSSATHGREKSWRRERSTSIVSGEKETVFRAHYLRTCSYIGLGIRVRVRHTFGRPMKNVCHHSQNDSSIKKTKAQAFHRTPVILHNLPIEKVELTIRESEELRDH